MSNDSTTRPTFSGSVHATEETETRHLINTATTRYVDGYRPFVSIEVGAVSFFVHPDHAVALAEKVLAVTREAVPETLDVLRSLFTKEVSQRDFEGSLAEFCDLLSALAEAGA